jgi:hypothetical protein
MGGKFGGQVNPLYQLIAEGVAEPTLILESLWIKATRI